MYTGSLINLKEIKLYFWRKIMQCFKIKYHTTDRTKGIYYIKGKCYKV